MAADVADGASSVSVNTIAHHGDVVQNFLPYGRRPRRLDQCLAESLEDRASLRRLASEAPQAAAIAYVFVGMAILEARNLNIAIPTGDGMIHAAQDVSFSVEAGEMFGIAGESGSAAW